VTDEALELTKKRDAVWVALQNACVENKLDIAAAIYAIPEYRLRQFVAGQNDALSEFEITFLADALRDGP